jgi:hypothetical protein
VVLVLLLVAAGLVVASRAAIMTLDELIDRLLEIRHETPAAGCATVVGFDVDAPAYRGGEVWFGHYDPDHCELIEIEMPQPPPIPKRHLH